nr:hypothetical protein [Gemmatimonadaceae bacterium]
ALIVFDNCEHVREGAARLVTTLLARHARLTVLCTSREPLGIDGEIVWPVSPLATPDPAMAIDAVRATPAVTLFLARARDANAHFAASARQLDAIARICRQLDGVPLAIELAAASVRTMPPAVIADRLDDALRLLTSPATSRPERHRSLEAALRWSWDLLSAEEQRLLRLLSVFAGGASLDAIDAVGTAWLRDAHVDSLSTLAALVDRSLVVVDDGDAPRYRLLEPTRQFAAARLRDAGEDAAAGDAHAAWVCAMGRALAARYGEVGWWPAPAAARDRDNIMRAVRHLAATRGRSHEALAVLDDLWIAFVWTQDWQPLARVADAVLDAVLTDGQVGSVRARARMVASYFATRAAQPAQAAALARDAIAEARTLDDVLLLARAVDAQAWATADSDIATAQASVQELVGLLPRIDNALYLAFLQLGSPPLVAAMSGDLPLAAQRFADAEATWRALAIDWGIGHALHGRAVVALHAAQIDDAVALAWRAVTELPGEREIAASWVFMVFAAAAEAAGDVTRALTLYAVQQREWQRCAVRPTPIETVFLDTRVAALRERVAADEFASAWGAGLARSTDDALSMAREMATVSAAASGAPPVAQPIAGVRPSSSRPAIDLRVLGPFEVQIDGLDAPAGTWPYAKPRELCAYLACHPGGRTREQIGAALWPELTAAQVKNNLHVTLHHARRALGDRTRVEFTRGRYRLAIDTTMTCDMVTFDRLADEWRRVHGAGARIPILQSLVALWRGPFCDGEPFGTWVDDERDRLQVQYIDALLALGQAAESVQAHASAHEAYRRATAEDALWEAAHRGLLRALLALGRREEAAAHGAALVERLRRELDVAPDPETTALLASIASR